MAAPSLPVRQVVLFSSGVGYFQREAEVLGNESVTLSVPAADVSDLLKSLVVRDQNGGHLKGISCDTAEPVAHALRSFAFNLADNPTLGELLDQARGEKLQVMLPATASLPPLPGED